MFSRREDLKPPRWNQNLWRYMGLDKFMEMVQSQKLYFSNCANMTDQYEATIPTRTMISRRSHKLRRNTNVNMVDEQMEQLVLQYEEFKKNTFINCWSQNTHESYSLWKIYLGGARAGIAIKSNSSLIESSIVNSNNHILPQIYIGFVDYTDFIPSNKVTWQKVASVKSPFYTSENEVRLFIFNDSLSQNQTRNRTGVTVKIDLDILIDKLLISPFAGAWFINTFKNYIDKNHPSLLDKIEISLIKDE